MRLKFGISALAACFALTFTGCDVLEDILTGPDHKPPHEHGQNCETVGAATMAPLHLIDVLNDPYRLLSVGVDGDILCAEVEYGGGCEEHQFNLLVNTDIMESEPMQIQAMITHNSHNDLCKALITKKAGFDLTPLKERLREMTGQESGSVVIHVGGSGPDHSVTYKY